MVCQTRRSSTRAGSPVGTATRRTRPGRSAWSDPSPQARQCTSNLFARGLRAARTYPSLVHVFLGITGASGAPYARRLLSALDGAGCEVGVTVSAPAIEVL